MEGYEESTSEGGGEVRSTTFRISVHSSAIIYSSNLRSRLLWKGMRKAPPKEVENGDKL